MRVLVWSPNYAPEPTGIAPLVTDAAERLMALGDEVDVVTAVPNYPHRRILDGYRDVPWLSETRNGVRVHRSWLRARHERSFVDKALYELTISTFALRNALARMRRADVVVCVVPTVLAAVYAAVLTRLFGKRLVLWVQDVVSTAGAAVVGRRGSRVMKLVRSLEGFAARSADRIIVCSPGFVEHFVELGVERDCIEVVLNWVDTERIAPQPERRNGALHALYAGNIGYTQGLETLVRAAEALQGAVAVDIVGEGNAAEEIRALAAPASNVTTRDPVADEEYPDLLASADVHVVVQRNIGAGGNLPSKIATTLASGRPVVASIPVSTPAGELLVESGGAVLVEPESPTALADALRELAADPARRAELGRRGRAFAESRLSRAVGLERLTGVIRGYA